MKLMKALFAIPLVLFPVPALGQAKLEDLRYSFPAHESVETEYVSYFNLTFDGVVHLVSVQVTHPDGTKSAIYDAFTDNKPFGKDETFLVMPREPLEAPGKYTVSYAISMTRANNTTDTNIGEFSFTIKLPVPAPDAPGDETGSAAAQPEGD